MPYDIIGDVHGCYDEFITLVKKLGYIIDEKNHTLSHPEGRILISLGDITDRGPESVKMMETICNWVEKGQALYAPGNHCNKLYRYFLGRNVQVKHGLETTVAELEALDDKTRRVISHRFKKLYEKAPLYLILDDGKLVVAHAGIKSRDIGKTGKRIESFVLYGDITGEFYPDGKPIRRDWAKHEQSHAWIIYGHTPVKAPREINHTINIDTGCVFGGALTACRYPEMELVSVPSKQPYLEDKFTDFE